MITNKQIRELITIRDKARARRESGLYIVEGIRMFKEVPGDICRQVIASRHFYEEHREELEEILSRIQKEQKAGPGGIEVVEDNVFEKLSDTKTPQGIMCVCKQKLTSVSDIISDRQNALYMILEDIQDPGNMGTIFRTGEGAGVSGIILTEGCVDIYNPKTIRSTMGSVYRVPFAVAKDLGAAVDMLKSRGVKVYAAHLEGSSYYDEVNYGSAAFMIGNEGNGLKADTAAMADTYIKIPMEGEVESLNAAVASSILMYEHMRQRRGLFT